MSKEAVTVIGLGPMGQAMVRAFLSAGHPTTVWNRTAAKADTLAAEGATKADTAADAVAASELIVLSLTDYQAMYDILGSATAGLTGRVVVNLSSDTPDRSREAAEWASQHGANFLTGGVMCPAPMVGTEAAYVYFSGPEQVLDRHKAALERVGAPRYLGEDPGLAQLMYLANLDVFLTSLSSLMHGTALMQSAGLTAAEVVPELMQTLTGTADMLNAGENPGAQIDTGEHPGHLSTSTMMGATADHIVETSEAVGIDLTLPRAIQGHYRATVEAGHGGDNWTRIIDAIRNPQ